MALQNEWPGAAARRDIHDVSIEDHLRPLWHLPQSKALYGIIDHLRRHAPGFEEAYLKGSFSTGKADDKSDIDLFLVVDPERLEETYRIFSEYLSENLPVAVASDSLNETDPFSVYGGIDFAFLCKSPHQDDLLYLDLYIVAKGVPTAGCKLFNPCRVYARDPSYSWTEKSRLAAGAKEQMESFRSSRQRTESVEHALEKEFASFLVTLSRMKKHIARDQMARAHVDAGLLISSAVVMMRTFLGRESWQAAIYAADELVADCRKDAGHPLYTAAGRLETLIRQKTDARIVGDYYDFGVELMRVIAPEALLKYEGPDASFRQYLEDRAVGTAMAMSRPSNNLT